MATVLRILVAALLAGASGCAAYRALPLDPAAERTALAGSDLEQIRMEAARIHHPLLRPVHLDLARGLTPDQAAVAAVLGNPELRAARDRRRLAQAQLVQAGLLPNPAFSFEHDQPTGSNPPGTVTGHSAQLGWDLNALWEQGLRRRVAAAQGESVDLAVAWQEWQVAQAARMAAFRVLALDEQLPLAQARAAQARHSLEAVAEAARAGGASGAEEAAARLEYDRQRQAALELQAAGTRARLDLKGLLGLPPEASLPLRKGVPLPTWEDLPTQAALVQGIGEQRLDLLALKQGYASQDARYRLAIRDQFPPIGILVGEVRDTGGVTALALGGHLRLPFFDRNQGQVAYERASRRQLHDEYQARLFSAQTQIAGILVGLETLRARIQMARDALKPLEASAAAYRAALAYGGSDRFSAARAQGAFLGQALALARLRAEQAGLGVELEVASGRYLPSRGGPGPLRP